MKIFFLFIISLVVLISCQSKPSEQEVFNTKAIEFKHKFDSINSISPYTFATKCIEIYKKVDTTGFVTDDFINQQYARSFERSANNNINLCAEMIIFKLGSSKSSKPSDEQIKDYVSKLSLGKLDKIDKLIYNTFNLSVLYFDNQIDYLDNIENSLYRF